MSNKVHVNNSTRISLNDRFTIMQSVGVPAPTAGPSAGAPIMRHPRSRSRSRSRSVGRMAQSVSPMTSPRVQAILPAARSRLARHYEDVIERRHHIARAPQPMRMKPAIRNISAKQRLALAMANRGPGAMASMRATRRPLARPRNARAALATMQMDRMAASVPSRRRILGRSMATNATTLRQRRLNRAVATVNQARLNSAAGGVGGRRLFRMDLVRSMDKANLIRQRSRSRSNVRQAAVGGQPIRGRSRSRSILQPARSQSNLRRSNSRLSLNQAQQQQQQPRRKINRDFQQRSRSRSRQQTPSIASRLGVRPGGNGNQNNNRGVPTAGGRRQQPRSNSVSARLGGAVKQGGLNRVAQGRVSKQQRLGGQKQPLQSNKGKRNQKQLGGKKPGKQMTRGRGGLVAKKNLQAAAAGAGKRGKKVSALQQRLQKGGGQKQHQPQRGQQQQGPGKGRRGKRGAGAGAPKRPLKKEDLDKELDKYMSTSN